LSDISRSPLTPFGSEIHGLALWSLDDADTFTSLASHWAHDGIMLLRRQALSERELLHFSQQFGTPHIILRDDWQSKDCPEIIKITNMRDYYGESLGALGAGELDWHTDQSYVTEPATGSILHMVEMPTSAPKTYWANLQLAYAMLSPSMQARIERLEVVYDYLARQSTYDDEPEMTAELRRRTPPVKHPLVQAHPLTGKRSLYLDPTTAAYIDGWDEQSSLKLLSELAAHATQPEFVYVHEWQVGDVVMWDNAILMHKRDAFDPAGNRLLKRATLRMPPDLHIVPRGTLVAW
jgi:taurine dioxygenase